jgi:hypothetical protein
MSSMLDISMRSLETLKRGMREIETEMKKTKRNLDGERQEAEEEDQKLQVIGPLLGLRSRSSSSSSSSTTNANIMAVSPPVSNPSRKLSNFGRRSVAFTEQQQENIR